MKKFVVRVLSVAVLVGGVTGMGGEAQACSKRGYYYQSKSSSRWK